MNWNDIKGVIGNAAPLLGTALGGPAGAAVGGLIAAALGADQTPEAVEAAVAGNPEAMLTLKRLEQEHERDLRRMLLEAETTRLAEVNATIRAEAASSDPYVRRWRPTFGYLTALAWLLQAVGITWAIVWEPGQAGAVAQAVTALTPMWGVALAVLGVSVHQRSKDKQVQAGQEPKGLLDLLARK